MMPAGIVALVFGALPAEAEQAHTLFVVTRSKNANVVKYDARITKAGTLDKRAPIDAYWLMYAADGRREELTFLERKLAYGFSISNVTDTTGTLSLTACAERTITLERSRSGEFQARILILGRPATLKRIFVRSEEGTLPRIAYVELLGIDEARGKWVKERLTP
jgi:hypothetical protein